MRRRPRKRTTKEPNADHPHKLTTKVEPSEGARTVDAAPSSEDPTPARRGVSTVGSIVSRNNFLLNEGARASEVSECVLFGGLQGPLLFGGPKGPLLLGGPRPVIK